MTSLPELVPALRFGVATLPATLLRLLSAMVILLLYITGSGGWLVAPLQMFRQHPNIAQMYSQGPNARDSYKQ